MTYGRLYNLIDMSKRRRTRDLYDFGQAMALAFHEPKELQKLLPQKEFDMNSLPGPLRIPKKKVA